MLQGLHDRVKGTVATFIVGLVILSFAIIGVSSYVENRSAERPVAQVGSSRLTSAAFEHAVQRAFSHTQQDPNTLTPAQLDAFKKQVLEDWKTQAALSQYIQQLGFQLTDAKAFAILAQWPALQEDGRFSARRFQSLLKSTGLSEHEFLASFKSDLLIEQFAQGITASDFVSTATARRFQRILHETRQVQFLEISLTAMPVSVSPTAAERQAYYETHLAQFRVPERIRIEYVHLKAEDPRYQINLSSDEARQFYRNHVQQFQKPAQYEIAYLLIRPGKLAPHKLKKVQQALSQGVSFEDVVKQYSDDVLTRRQGGILPLRPLQALDPSVQAVVKTLKVGEHSKPFQTPYGTQIIRLHQLLPAETQPFEKVQAEIRQQLLRQKRNHAFQQDVAKMGELAYTNPDNLEALRSALNLPLQQTPWVSTEGIPGDPLLGNPKFLKVAWSPLVKSQGVNSDVISLTPDAAFVMRVQASSPAHVSPLSEVLPQIDQALQRTMQLKKAVALGEDIRRNPEHLPAGYRWSSVLAVKRDSKSIKPRWVEAAFGVAPSPQLERPAVFVIPPKTQADSVLVVRLMKVETPDIDPAQDRAALHDYLRLHRTLEWSALQEAIGEQFGVVARKE